MGQKLCADIRVGIHGGALILLALMILVLPIEWLFAALFAGVVHEFCHGAAVILCGGRIRSVSVGTGGAVMTAHSVSGRKEIICVLAGPAGGLLLLFLARWLPRTAFCAALQSLFNLLPVFPLDGGRALQCGLRLIMPEEKGDRLCRWIERAVVTVLLLFMCLLVFVWKMGVLALLPAGALLIGIRRNGKLSGDNFSGGR